MNLKSDAIWLANPIEDSRFEYQCIRSDAALIKARDIFYLITPYQEYDKDLQYGSIIDVMGIVEEKYAIEYATAKATSAIGSDVGWINLTDSDICSVNISSIFSWSTAVDEKYRSKFSVDGSCQLISEFGALKLVKWRNLAN